MGKGNETMRHRCGTCLTIIGTVLIAAALVLLVFDCWDNWRAGNSVAEIQAKLDDADSVSGVGNASDAPDSLTSGNASDGSASGSESAEAEMATVEIDGYAYIGTLSISRFGLELPVMSEWSYPGLRIAPCRYSGSVWTDDLVLCGHNYDRHFGNLKNLEEGDIVSFTDVEGNVFEYEVQEVTTLRPTDIDEMLGTDTEETEWDLTLFTCTLGGQARVTVRCSRVEE